MAISYFLYLFVIGYPAQGAAQTLCLLVISFFVHFPLASRSTNLTFFPQFLWLNAMFFVIIGYLTSKCTWSRADILSIGSVVLCALAIGLQVDKCNFFFAVSVLNAFLFVIIGYPASKSTWEPRRHFIDYEADGVTITHMSTKLLEYELRHPDVNPPWDAGDC